MIVLSASMPKSGSVWYYHMTNDLLVAGGYDDAYEVRKRYGLHFLLKYRSCHIDGPGWWTPLLLLPHFSGRTFAVSRHCGPGGVLGLLRACGFVRPTYIFRDPRDVMISALEHGQKLRDDGQTGYFANLHSFEDALRSARRWVGFWEEWRAYGRALMVRYEDLLSDTPGQLRRLAAYLEIAVEESVLTAIAARYNADTLRQQSKERSFHLGTARTGRFRGVMTAEQVRTCNDAFGAALAGMGYDP